MVLFYLKKVRTNLMIGVEESHLLEVTHLDTDMADSNTDPQGLELNCLRVRQQQYQPLRLN